MTAQIGDIYKYHNQEYFIVALSSPKLFVPKEYGLETHPSSTACWRGYWCDYMTTDNKLILKHLYSFNKDGNYPVLNGVEAIPPKDEHNKKGKKRNISIVGCFGHHTYKNLNLPIRYTGRILLGKDFINGYSFHYRHARIPSHE